MNEIAVWKFSINFSMNILKLKSALHYQLYRSAMHENLINTTASLEKIEQVEKNSKIIDNSV